MRTCSKCYTQAPDAITVCPKCQADLTVFSTTAVALQHLLENPRVKAIRISVPREACPLCSQVQGIHAKDKVPVLPVAGCSEPNGCCAFYDPVLSEIYP